MLVCDVLSDNTARAVTAVCKRRKKFKRIAWVLNYLFKKIKIKSRLD